MRSIFNLNETKPEGNMEGDFDLDLHEEREEAASTPWWANLEPAGWLAQGMHLITHEEVRLARQAGLEVYAVFKLKRWAVGDQQPAAGASGEREVNISPAEQAANAATLDRWARAALASTAREQKPVARFLTTQEVQRCTLGLCSQASAFSVQRQFAAVNGVEIGGQAQPEQVAQNSEAIYEIGNIHFLDGKLSLRRVGGDGEVPQHMESGMLVTLHAARARGDAT